MKDWTRLAFRLQKTELVTLAVLIGFWVLVAAVLVWQIRGYADSNPGCFGLTSDAPVDCQRVQAGFAGWDQTAEVLLWSVLAIPVVIGVILGISIVGREIEQRTAALVWSLAVSRTAWLLKRSAPIVGALFALVSIVAIGGEILTVTRLGGDDPGFYRFDQRGILVIVRSLVAASLALAVGAWLGRLLPALLVSFVVASAVIGGIAVVMNQWQQTEAEVVRVQDLGGTPALANGLVLGPVGVLPDGTVTRERNIEDLPEGTDFDWVQVLPSTTYWTWVGREALIALLVAAMALLTSIVITIRRLPRA